MIHKVKQTQEKKGNKHYANYIKKIHLGNFNLSSNRSSVMVSRHIPSNYRRAGIRNSTRNGSWHLYKKENILLLELLLYQKKSYNMQLYSLVLE